MTLTEGTNARQVDVLRGAEVLEGAGATLLEESPAQTFRSPQEQTALQAALKREQSAFTILGVDVGTTGMKMGVFRVDGDALVLVRQFTRHYAVNTYNDGLFSDIEPEKWQQAFVEGCHEMQDLMGDVDAVSLSGTTPGLIRRNERTCTEK